MSLSPAENAELIIPSENGSLVLSWSSWFGDGHLAGNKISSWWASLVEITDHPQISDGIQLEQKLIPATEVSIFVW